MNKGVDEVRELRLEDLKPFSIYTSQIYQGERMEQLMSSIDRRGLITPIIVRPVDGGKYEIVCGHNRTEAMRKLGHDSILAEVREGLSDNDAIELFYDSNLNQQSFSDWSYSQKIKAIQYTEALIEKESQQGKRSDLAEKQDTANRKETSVQSRHKSEGKSRRSTTRDRMARRLGIATATFSKYRRIIKLPNEQIDAISFLLDERKITFETAFIISKLDSTDANWLIEEIYKSPDKKVDINELKLFEKRGKEPGMLAVHSRDLVKRLLIPRATNK